MKRYIALGIVLFILIVITLAFACPKKKPGHPVPADQERPEVPPVSGAR